MRLAALVLAALPAVALAQEPAPSTTAAAPQWSIGAGVLFGDDTPDLIGVTPGGAALLVPAVRASLERRVGDRSWLVLAVSGAIRSDEADDGTSTGEASLRGGYLAVGGRRAVTAPEAPVEVSVYALGELGRTGYEADVSGLSGSYERSFTLAGFSVGVAVERRLLEALSVRIFSRVARAGWAWGEEQTPDDEKTEVSAFEAGVALVPGVELRMQF